MYKDKREHFDLSEILNSTSHGLMAILSIAGLIILIFLSLASKYEWALFSSVIYGVSLIILYTSSTIYHAIARINLKKKFQILDHVSIFILIAGTYTPVVLLTIGGSEGWLYFIIQWTMAGIGAILKLFYTGKYEKLSLILYVLMGWMAVVEINHFYKSLSTSGFWLLLSGGIVYTAGIIFYILDQKIKFCHFIWHLFVITGTVLHYLLISLYVI